MKKHEAHISEICRLLDLNFIGNDVVINNLNLCNRPTKYSSILGYITSCKFYEFVVLNKSVKALVLSPSLFESFVDFAKQNNREYTYIVTENPEYCFYDIHNKLFTSTCFYNDFDFDTIIGKDCHIHPSVVVEDGVIIGNNVTIGPNSVVRKGSVIDDNVCIGCCTVIGSEGFQAIREYDKMVKHVGGTHICHNAYIGDNTTVGNALFEGSTEVGEYSKLDNHVHFAHNCKCGKNCVITACSLLMGSTRLKNNVWLACNAVILNGCTVDDNGFVGTLAYVNKDVEKGKTVIGIPARELIKK